MNTPRVVAMAIVFTSLSLGAGAPPADPAPRDAGVKPAGLSRANHPLPPVDFGAESPAAAKSRLKSAAARPTRPPAPRAAAAPGPTVSASPGDVDLPAVDPKDVFKSVSTVALFALVSLAPAAVLMVTAFVRINIVLVLLRQALGSPQVPGNQVLTALALLLTALVMRPVGEVVYARAIEPYSKGKATWSEALRAARAPVQTFMVDQIERTNHANYLWAIHDEVARPGDPDPVVGDDFPFGEVATAYLLSELTTALVFGFYLYLPFLVVDLVVSAVLAAMGLFMLPPSLVALPLKLILFVLIDGWLRVAVKLLQSFGTVGA